MKKTSFIKKLSLSLATVGAVAPLVVLATSCSDTKAVTTTYISFNSFKDLLDEGKELNLTKMENGHFSNDSILLGDKRFYKGNYVLFVGSNGYLNAGKPSSTMQFFGGESNMDQTVEQWFTTLFGSSYWANDIQQAWVLRDRIDREFGFVTFIDNFNFKVKDKTGHEIFVTETGESGGLTTAIGPFDKWGDKLVPSRRYNKEHGYEFDKDEELTSDDYIRIDDQAKTYRAFCERGKAMFPTTEKRTKTFNTDANNTEGYMLIYKDGRLQEIAGIPIVIKEGATPDDKDEDTKTLFGAINKYFTEHEEEK